MKKTKEAEEEYDENEINIRKLYLLLDLNEEPERRYKPYKQREYGEYAFNGFKNAQVPIIPQR